MEFLSGQKLATHIEDRLASILDGDVTMARKVLKAKQQPLFQSDDGSCAENNKGFLRKVNALLGDNTSLSTTSRVFKALQLATITYAARKKLSLLLDVTGHQIFNDGLYNG